MGWGFVKIAVMKTIDFQLELNIAFCTKRHTYKKNSMIFYQVTFLSKIYKNTLLKYEKNYCTYLRLFSSRHLSEITLAESINQTANGTKNV